MMKPELVTKETYEAEKKAFIEKHKSKNDVYNVKTEMRVLSDGEELRKTTIEFPDKASWFEIVGFDHIELNEERYGITITATAKLFHTTYEHTDNPDYLKIFYTQSHEAKEN